LLNDAKAGNKLFTVTVYTPPWLAAKAAVMVVCWPPRPLLAAVELEQDKEMLLRLLRRFYTHTQTSSVKSKNFAAIEQFEQFFNWQLQEYANNLSKKL
jgi:hypothetical protein